MNISIESIIDFYDSKKIEDGKNASAITGLLGEDLGSGLLIHYLENNKYSCEVLNVTPTEGFKKGKWLDRWIVAKSATNNYLYQVEIKNWSSHSIGGRKIPLDATEKCLLETAIFRHFQEWNDDLRTFKNDYVGKVLRKMKIPREYQQSNYLIKPVICFWYPITEPKSKSPLYFYELDCSDSFEKVTFFSMSLYLRYLLKSGYKTINIKTPVIEQRLEKIKAMFPPT